MPAFASRRAMVPVALGAASLVFASVALAAPSTGHFKTTSGPAFAFSITKGTCKSAPKNLTNPKARAGAARRGLCFASPSDPPVATTCPSPASLSGAQADIQGMSGLRLSPSGKLHLKLYAYTSAPDPVGDTELSLAVKGKTASGYVRYTGDGLQQRHAGALRLGQAGVQGQDPADRRYARVSKSAGHEYDRRRECGRHWSGTAPMPANTPGTRSTAKRACSDWTISPRGSSLAGALTYRTTSGPNCDPRRALRRRYRSSTIA